MLIFLFRFYILNPLQVSFNRISGYVMSNQKIKSFVYVLLFNKYKRRLVMRKTYETNAPYWIQWIQFFYPIHYYYITIIITSTTILLLLWLLCPPLRNCHSYANRMYKGLPVQVTAGIRGSLPEEGVFRLHRILVLYSVVAGSAPCSSEHLFKHTIQPLVGTC